MRTEFKKRADQTIHPVITDAVGPVLTTLLHTLETFRMFRGTVIPRNVNQLINSTGTGQVLFISMLQVFSRGPIAPSECE